MSAAIALHNALDSEREIRLRLELGDAKEEAWQSAAQLAIHQLANKLSPAESDCNYVQSWLQSHFVETTAGFGDVDDALSNAQKSIAFARGILVDFRRYASDEPFKDIREYRVDELLKNIRDHLGAVCQQLNVKVDPTVTNRLVSCSRNAMLEVFEVLALNSLSHSRKTAVDLRVSITNNEILPSVGLSVSPSEEVCLVFRDNGYGISSRDRPRIFEAFFTTHQKGNGLGLAIAQRFMHRQGGRMTEDGTDGDGARFCVYLPIVEAANQGHVS